jgi:hypothetical protein
MLREKIFLSSVMEKYHHGCIWNQTICNAFSTNYWQEKDHQTLDFSKERALWEQKKLSEMSIFNAFKEEEVNYLGRWYFL